MSEKTEEILNYQVVRPTFLVTFSLLTIMDQLKVNKVYCTFMESHTSSIIIRCGGAIIAKYSELHIHHIIIIANNIAQISGGGIYLYRSELHCYFNCTFFQNIATEMGGGIHAVSSRIITSTAILKNSTKFLFSNNKARLGGAVSLK